jgi:hypothetical protein
MAEQRRYSRLICVWAGAKRECKLELFPSEQWPDGAPGRFRVRVNRRWLDAPEGGRMYLDQAQVGALLAERLGGPALQDGEVPDLRRGQPVRVPNGRQAEDGSPLHDLTRVAGAPIRGFDGRWHVPVVLIGRGLVHVPATEILQER